MTQPGLWQRLLVIKILLILFGKSDFQNKPFPFSNITTYNIFKMINMKD